MKYVREDYAHKYFAAAAFLLVSCASNATNAPSSSGSAPGPAGSLETGGASPTDGASAVGTSPGDSTPMMEGGGMSGPGITGRADSGVSGNPAAMADASPCSAIDGAGQSVNIALHQGYSAGSRSFPNPNNAFDGDVMTDSGPNTNTDGMLAVDLGSEKSPYRTVVHFVGETPQRYKIQGSNDGAAWSDILRVSNPNFTDERILPSANYRYLRFAVYQNSATGENPNVLSPVSEIEVYERSANHPPDCAVVYPVPLDRTGWVATTNNGGPAQGTISSPSQGWIDPHGAFDGPDFWVQHQGEVVGSYVEVDMKTAQTFNQIYAQPNHVAIQDYAIYVSDDGLAWGNAVVTASIVPTGAYYNLPFTFPAQHKRYFKIQSNFDSSGKYWGFWNISALNTDAAMPIDPSDNVNLALNKPTAGSNVKNPTLVFDGNDATGIDDAGVIVVDLGMAYSIAKINVKFASTSDGSTFHIETSNDGTAWTMRQSVFVAHLFSHVFTQTIMGNYSTRYLRLSFGTSHPHDVDIKQNINEIEVYKVAGSKP